MTEKIIIKAMPRIDAPNAPRFQQLLEKAMENGQNQHITVDMGDTAYISSVGLRVLLLIQKKLQRMQGSLTIANIRPQIMEIFEITGFSGIFTVEDCTRNQ